MQKIEKIRINENEIDGIVDLASEVSLIDDSVIQPSQNERTILIEGMSGNPQRLPFMELKVSCNGRSGNHYFAIMPNLESIIGQKALIGRDLYQSFV